MALRRDDACCVCSGALPAGSRAHWNPAKKVVTCLVCIEGSSTPPAPAPDPVEAPVAPSEAVREVPPDAAVPADAEPPPPIDLGQPGASARAEFERRHARREARIEAKWGTGTIGKVAKALSDDPQSTRAWAQGAAGEERVAQVLHERVGDRAVVLHDRRVPGTRANIDHIAVAPSGIWVIDAKRSQGKVAARDIGGWFRTDVRLYVGGRDRTKAVQGMAWQVAAVQKALRGEAVPIHPVLTFVGADWPLFFAKPLQFEGVLVSWPKKLAELVGVEGPLTASDVDRIARTLATRLPAK